MKKHYNNYIKQLQTQRECANFRELKPLKLDGKYIIKGGKKLLNLSSNDYLGISTYKNIQESFLKTYSDSISIPSARLLCANSEAYYELEQFLKNAFNKEAALLFNSGYHANVGIYSSLAKKGDVVFCDKLNHASIIDGIRLGAADLIPFKHANYEDLEHKLKLYRHKYENAIISSEALFSMDGDFCNINKLVELKEAYNAILVIDEAHSFGVYGNGLGFCKQMEQVQNVDLIMATFGKAVGSYGAFCTGDKVLIDYLTNFARSFIFSTVFPQISARFALYVLKNHIFNDNSLPKKLLSLTNYTHQKLAELNVLGSSYIVPLVLGENQKAISASETLLNNGYYCLPIRYPTVAKNSARLRISLNSSMSEADLDGLIAQIKKL